MPNMTSDHAQRLARWGGAAGLLGLSAAFSLIGWWLLQSTFMIYDDEGYVLIGMRNFSAGHALYDEVFTQYGPFPFLYHDSWHRLLGLPLAHTLGRLLTLLQDL
jgi:hypothetical protein